jgi:hypothetical protein
LWRAEESTPWAASRPLRAFSDHKRESAGTGAALNQEMWASSRSVGNWDAQGSYADLCVPITGWADPTLDHPGSALVPVRLSTA